ncbi:MAG: hypothetical protein ACI965_002239, partial [Paraglaciecola sp.]
SRGVGGSEKGIMIILLNGITTPQIIKIAEVQLKDPTPGIELVCCT